METLFQFTDKLLAAHPQIGAIGISVQGVVKKDGKIVACDAKPLAGLNLKAKLQERFHLPVVCENDMNLVAYGLMLKKALGREASIAVLAKYSAVPSGAGLIVDGHFLRGSTDFAGEVSFLPTPDSAPFSLTLYQLLSLITVANPACIALTGDQVTEDAVAQLQKQIRRFIPAEHCPRLTLLKTPFLYARQGLFALCLKELEHE